MRGGLGRIAHPDIRDHQYLLRSLVRPEALATLPVSKEWPLGPILDQGNTSKCVGYGWRQFLSSAPLMTTTGPDAPTIYHQAQLLDEWPGEEPTYYGTTVRAGAAALKGWGHLDKYYWAFSVQEIIEFVLSTGPVVVGTEWLEGMDDPVNGVLHATGQSRGGHCYMIYGADTATGMLKMVNSWGTSWGIDGTAQISFSDFQKLMDMGGEACVGSEVAVVSPPPEPEPERPGCWLAGWWLQFFSRW